MLRFLARRFLLTIPVLLGVATLVFALIHLIPGDPVRTMLGESATEDSVIELRGRLGLDRPLPATFELAAAAMVVAIVAAIPLGIVVAAAGAGTFVDHPATTLALAGISMPNIRLGPLLALVQSCILLIAVTHVSVNLLTDLAYGLPGLAIALLVLGFNFLGDGLRDLTDPKQPGRAAAAVQP